jgi:hypothetical protein
MLRLWGRTSPEIIIVWASEKINLKRIARIGMIGYNEVTLHEY